MHLQRQTPVLGDEWQRADGTEVRFPSVVLVCAVLVSTGSHQGKGHERKINGFFWFAITAAPFQVRFLR